MLPDPLPGPGQVVIDVAVADTLSLDTQLRAAWGGECFTIHPSYVPGTGVAGQVVAVREGVDPGWVARRVIASTGQTDGYAEQAVAKGTRWSGSPTGSGCRRQRHSFTTATPRGGYPRRRAVPLDRRAILGMTTAL